jgi:Pet100
MSQHIRKLFNTGGKGSFAMEAWKFAVYLAVPIGASIYYSSPGRMKETAEYWKFIEYPANPTVGIKEQILLAHKQKEQREAYRKQLQALHQPNKPSEPEDQEAKPGFWRRLFGWKGE